MVNKTKYLSEGILRWRVREAPQVGRYVNKATKKSNKFSAWNTKCVIKNIKEDKRATLCYFLRKGLSDWVLFNLFLRG